MCQGATLSELLPPSKESIDPVSAFVYSLFNIETECREAYRTGMITQDGVKRILKVR